MYLVKWNIMEFAGYVLISYDNSLVLVNNIGTKLLTRGDKKKKALFVFPKFKEPPKQVWK